MKISMYSGMFGVAISRVRNLLDLQIINFTETCLKKPSDAILDFVDATGQETEVDPDHCCRGRVLLNEVIIFQRYILKYMIFMDCCHEFYDTQQV